jgi:hypothetical protein
LNWSCPQIRQLDGAHRYLSENFAQAFKLDLLLGVGSNSVIQFSECAEQDKFKSDDLTLTKRQKIASTRSTIPVQRTLIGIELLSQRILTRLELA